MLRGQRLFNGLIDEEEPKFSRRGRNEALIKRRNECLLYRYYYYSKIKRMRYGDVLKTVGEEFYIAPRTLSDILAEQAVSLKTIFKENPSIKELEKKFNYLNWKIILTL